jgi:hypothetical protein
LVLCFKLDPRLRGDDMIVIFLCVLCALCGGLFIFFAAFGNCSMRCSTSYIHVVVREIYLNF